MWQTLIISCIVAAAALHAGGKYLPASWRRRVVRGARVSKMAAWLDTRSGCGGGCSSCNACAETAAPEAGARNVIKLHPRQST